VSALPVDAVLLDAGNTLIGMDLGLLAGLAADAGVAVTVDRLARAEAAARPTVSRFLAGARESTEAGSARGVYLRAILAGLDGDLDLDALVPRLAEAVRRVPTVELWSQVLPGVPEALMRLRAAGLRLVVVSNADGTVEEGLTRAGLRARLDVIVDSFLVGAEKPDPRIFTHALAQAGTIAARAVHVGDLYAVDVLGARAAGIEGVLLDPYGDWSGVDCARFVDLGAFASALLGGTA
jgi:putative hydrolase of the HAD superfamily